MYVALYALHVAACHVVSCISMVQAAWRMCMAYGACCMNIAACYGRLQRAWGRLYCIGRVIGLLQPGHVAWCCNSAMTHRREARLGLGELRRVLPQAPHTEPVRLRVRLQPSATSDTSNSTEYYRLPSTVLAMRDVNPSATIRDRRSTVRHATAQDKRGAVDCRILSGTCRMVLGGTVGYRRRAIFDFLKLLELWQPEQTLNKPSSCRRIRPAAVILSGQSRRHRNSTRRGEPAESASSCAASVCCESRTCCMPLSTFCTTGCPQFIHK